MLEYKLIRIRKRGFECFALGDSGFLLNSHNVLLHYVVPQYALKLGDVMLSLRANTIKATEQMYYLPHPYHAIYLWMAWFTNIHKPK